MSIELIIIGLGNHTKNKIIPILKNLSIPIKAIITSTKISHYKNIKIYKDIHSIKDKKTITHCIISTMPSMQIKYIKEAALMNVKTFVEKPAFISEEDLNSVNSFFNTGFSLTEGMMYRFGAGYNYFYSNFSQKKDRNYELSLNFILPNDNGIILNTFRSDINIKNSIIYDMGPYIFDLLWTVNIVDYQISNIKIEQFENKLFKRLKFTLKLNNNNFSMKIKIDIGYGSSYINELNFNSKDNQFNVSPFFWGRSGKINIKEVKANKDSLIEIDTANALSEMLFEWFHSNKENKLMDLQSFNRYKFVTSQLGILEREIYKNVK